MNWMTPARAAKALAFLGAGLLCWSSITSEHSTESRWQTASVGPAFFLSQSAASQWAAGPAAGGSNRNHLPNSTFGSVGANARCSVDTSDPGTPPSCSVHATATAASCSAQCNSDQVCSAFIASSGAGGSAECSTSGVPNGICSSRRPIGSANGESFCSVRGTPSVVTGKLQCSTLRAAHRQICTAENPGTNRNFCSADGVGPNVQCSVLGQPVGINQRGFCSTGRIGQKRCSVQGTGTECSVLRGSLGTCTNLAGAPNGSCSTHTSLAGHCSVINGPAGNFCRQP